MNESVEEKPIETTLFRAYEKGDTFYIPDNVALTVNCGKFLYLDSPKIPLIGGTVVIIFEQLDMNGAGGLSMVKTIFEYPDGSRIGMEIPKFLLDTFPQDRRHGRRLDDIDAERAGEIHDRKAVFRRGDTKRTIRKLRKESRGVMLRFFVQNI